MTNTHELLPMTPEVEALLPDPGVIELLMLQHKDDVISRPTRGNNFGRPFIELLRDHPVTCRCEEGREPNWSGAFTYSKHTSVVNVKDVTMPVLRLLRPSWLHPHP